MVLELAALEDHLPMNPFTGVGQVKPGPSRKVTINVILVPPETPSRATS